MQVYNPDWVYNHNEVYRYDHDKVYNHDEVHMLHVSAILDQTVSRARETRVEVFPPFSLRNKVSCMILV